MFQSCQFSFMGEIGFPSQYDPFIRLMRKDRKSLSNNDLHLFLLVC